MIDASKSSAQNMKLALRRDATVRGERDYVTNSSNWERCGKPQTLTPLNQKILPKFRCEQYFFEGNILIQYFFTTNSVNSTTAKNLIIRRIYRRSLSTSELQIIFHCIIMKWLILNLSQENVKYIDLRYQINIKITHERREMRY